MFPVYLTKKQNINLHRPHIFAKFTIKKQIAGLYKQEEGDRTESNPKKAKRILNIAKDFISKPKSLSCRGARQRQLASVQ